MMPREVTGLSACSWGVAAPWPLQDLAVGLYGQLQPRLTVPAGMEGCVLPASGILLFHGQSGF